VRFRTKARLVVPIASAAAAAMILAACGSSSGAGASSSGPPASGAAPAAGTVAVDVGTGTPVKLSKGKLRVGIFMNAQSNQWQQNFANGAKAQAESYGWQATILDFGFDGQKMLDAFQSAVTKKTYDAWVVVPIDGNAECKMLTETAPKANILVTVGGTTVCNRDLNATAELWAPGTYSYHAMAPSPEYIKKFFAATGELNPGKQNVVFLGGPAANGAVIAFKKFGNEYMAAHPDFQIKDYLETDFTAPTTFTALQAYLQAHRDTTIVMSCYSPDVSRGGVKALDSMGLAGKVHFTDVGGSQFTVDEIKKGVIQATFPFYPKTQGTNAVIAIKDAQDGVTPKRIYDEIPGGLANVKPITKDNVDSFKPEY
jgi:ABC-type sugar transport system substrate-binding protein